ncbi:teichoic acid D-Ala incorporation-associated protein DltX [Desulfosporosinus burensis]
MNRWIASIAKGPNALKPTLSWLVRIAYYYLILMGLFILYVVQKQQTAAPFIYNNF